MKRVFSTTVSLLGVFASQCTVMDPSPDVVGVDAVVTDQSNITTDVVADVPSQTHTIEALLDAPSSFLEARNEAPGFGDATLQQLQQRIPRRGARSATPDAQGFLSDAIEAMPYFQPVREARTTRFLVTIQGTALGSEATTRTDGTLNVTQGAIVPRRVQQLEAGEAFRQRSIRIAPGQPGPFAALAELGWQHTLTPNDTDSFQALVYASNENPVLTLSINGRSFTIATQGQAFKSEVFAIDNETSVSITVQRAPEGPCTTTRALLRTQMQAASEGRWVGTFAGVLHRNSVPVGFVRGHFGFAPTAEKERLVLRAIGLDGTFLWSGVVDGDAGHIPRAGTLRNGTTSMGSFVVRRLVEHEGSNVVSRVALEMHTGCR